MKSTEAKYQNVIENNTFYYFDEEFELNYEKHIFSVKESIIHLKNEVQKTLTGEDIAVQIILLSILSALLLEKPFGVVIYSASSSGKSYIVNSIIECFGSRYDAIEQDGINITIKPGFGFISANSLTLAGLTRLTQNNPQCFDNKVLLLHEISDATSDDVRSVAISSDGKYIAAGGLDQKVYLFDKSSSTPLWSYSMDDYIGHVAISSDGKYVVAGIWYKVFLFDKSSSTPLWDSGTWGNVRSVAISSDGKYIVAGSYYTVYLFDKSSSTELWSYEIEQPITASPAVSGNRAIIGSEDRAVYCFTPNDTFAGLCGTTSQNRPTMGYRRLLFDGW